jgi:plasmid maintenance system antidote protein VapI
MVFKFNKLLGKMTEEGYSQKAMATELGISENSFTNKIKGRTNFTQLEIVSMCDVLGIANTQIGDYFFSV